MAEHKQLEPHHILIMLIGCFVVGLYVSAKYHIEHYGFTRRPLIKDIKIAAHITAAFFTFIVPLQILTHQN